MKIISERGKAENIYKSYQKQGKNAKSGTSKKTAGTMENSTIKSEVASKKKVKEDDDDSGGGDSRKEELGHEMTPSRKRMDVQVTAKPSYGPIQEMPTVQVSIDDAIGTFRCVHH
jgi:hypothetical protein